MAESRKIKIAFTTDGIFPHSIGGIQRHSALLIDALSAFKDVELHVIHPHKFKVFEKNDRINEYSIDDINTQKNYFKECYDYSARVEKVIEKIKPDLIYSQGITIWKNIHKYRNKLINNPHGLESFQAIGFKEKLVGILFKRIQRKIFRNSTIVASEGGQLTKILKREGLSNKIVFLPNAVNLPEVHKVIYKDKETPLTVFFMARIVKNKGIQVLFRCIEKLNRTGFENKFNFKLGGKGPLFDFYKQLNGFKNVELLGFLDDLQLEQNYLDADVFVLPTLFEGMPTVVLEAMSYGLPVIVSDVGGTSELINNETGYLIERNNVDALYKALIYFYKLESSQKSLMGKNAREKVRLGFTWNKLAEMHRDLFFKITATD